MTTSTQNPPTAAGNTWALLAHRRISWRQAIEGWAVVATAGGCVLVAAALVKASRTMARTRT